MSVVAVGGGGSEAVAILRDIHIVADVDAAAAADGAATKDGEDVDVDDASAEGRGGRIAEEDRRLQEVETDEKDAAADDDDDTERAAVEAAFHN